jgi:hypothetical protein
VNLGLCYGSLVWLSSICQCKGMSGDERVLQESPYYHLMAVVSTPKVYMQALIHVFLGNIVPVEFNFKCPNRQKICLIGTQQYGVG